MIIGKVRGTVVATRKDPRLEGCKLLVVETYDLEKNTPTGYVVAIDTVGAGAGEQVICVSGSSARMASGMKDHPVDTAIVGIMNTVQLDH